MVLLGFVVVAIALVHAVSVKRWFWAAILFISLAPVFLLYAGLGIAVVASGSYVVVTRLRSQDQPE